MRPLYNQEWKNSLWKKRWRKKRRSEPSPLQDKLYRYQADVLKESDPKLIIEAIQDLASFMKTIGYGKEAFAAIMENIESASPFDIKKLLRNKDNYLGNSIIIKI